MKCVQKQVLVMPKHLNAVDPQALVFLFLWFILVLFGEKICMFEVKELWSLGYFGGSDIGMGFQSE